MSPTESARTERNDKRKKPYRKPALVAYGDIRALTADVGDKGALDGYGAYKTDIVQ